MLIDFAKMTGMIPQGGSVSFTVIPKKNGKLAVLYQTKHSLLKVDSTYEKSLEDEKKEILEASQKLSKVLAFTGAPEELTERFEEMISRSCSAEKSLADAVSERTQELNEKIKALKEKKDSRKTVAGKPNVTNKEEKQPEKAKQAPSVGGLFGSIGTNASATEAVKEEETPAEEKDAGEEELGEVA
jgi:hypothetical protein